MTAMKIQDLNCKIRFAMSRLPYLPVRYRLTDESTTPTVIRWSKVLPFFDRQKGLFNFDLWGWDVRELRFLNKFLKPGMVFLDVGAYHGIYSVLAGRKVTSSGQVYAFEPTPSHSRRIQHHLRLNQINNVKVETLALSNSDGHTEFYIPVNGVMSVGSIKPSLSSRGKLKPTTVETIRLDNYVKQQALSRIDLIKVDVEGAELLFLDGATQTINDFHPLLVVEALDSACEPWGYCAKDLLLRIQQKFDYTFYGFSEQGYLHPHSIREIYPHDSNCNLLAVPRSATHRIAHLLTKQS
ncbi:FkbM family methyltransferase [Leptolyngbya sp. NK1-12]|uniref:FkbM family methyltransferase n=1 Tax=Leptolyngbya sp. NK1-12 TaxID=2547451 RepID=A0AA96WLK2_9CYAN|nr:FkbM family methyltransferase [Leptolyngbya sp. NK1-12]WNZ27310.1 FkbM family methyltransferase [Leptolyngbya sp. NK1-12]